jgi:hypothetical protein
MTIERIMIDDDNVQQIKNYIQRSNEFLEILILIRPKKTTASLIVQLSIRINASSQKQKGEKRKRKRKSNERLN